MRYSWRQCVLRFSNGEQYLRFLQMRYWNGHDTFCTEHHFHWLLLQETDISHGVSRLIRFCLFEFSTFSIMKWSRFEMWNDTRTIRMMNRKWINAKPKSIRNRTNRNDRWQWSKDEVRQKHLYVRRIYSYILIVTRQYVRVCTYWNNICHCLYYDTVMAPQLIARDCLFLHYWDFGFHIDCFAMFFFSLRIAAFDEVFE